MRKGGIVALKMDDISFNNGIITVRSTWSEKESQFKNRTKNDGYRPIEMNDDIWSILCDYRN